MILKLLNAATRTGINVVVSLEKIRQRVTTKLKARLNVATEVMALTRKLNPKMNLLMQLKSLLARKDVVVTENQLILMLPAKNVPKLKAANQTTAKNNQRARTATKHNSKESKQQER